MHDATEAQIDMAKIADQLELESAIKKLKEVDAESTDEIADSGWVEPLQEDVQEEYEQDENMED